MRDSAREKTNTFQPLRAHDAVALLLAAGALGLADMHVLALVFAVVVVVNTVAIYGSEERP